MNGQPVGREYRRSCAIEFRREGLKEALAFALEVVESAPEDIGLEVVERVRQAVHLGREHVDHLERVADARLLEATFWRGEARTQETTVREIYQLISGSRGEPGTWRGVRPVMAALAKLRTEVQIRDIYGQVQGRKHRRALHIMTEACRELGILHPRRPPRDLAAGGCGGKFIVAACCGRLGSMCDCKPKGRGIQWAECPDPSAGQCLVCRGETGGE